VLFLSNDQVQLEKGLGLFHHVLRHAWMHAFVLKQTASTLNAAAQSR
jgi:hypothetical protein